MDDKITPVGSEQDFIVFAKKKYVELCIVGSLFLFAMLVYWIGRCNNSKGNNFVLFNFLFICYDLAFDITFLIKNAKEVPGLFKPALIILIVSGSINLTMSFALIIQQRIYNPAFSNWLKENHRFAALITVFSAANIQALKIISSNYGGMTVLQAKYSSNGQRAIAWGGVLNLAFQDIPQLVILAKYWTKTKGYVFFPFISLVLSIIILFIDFFGRIYDAIIITNNDDGTTRRLNNRSSDSTYQYSMRVGAP
ncbi:hypothetical protein RclHR1_11470004 [Rhizophagus clarus]|uniref:Uncharacterized protein n=1 Tax=Rhizophagus clarus TaxID=94130 RepID=A0A2Z6Q445_9GLOM|nr:hypothetical protein RclHR1_11470004 [Rhizophagus clarus]GES84858.1 hypothetical protein GLOIN_2v1704742 [Rhizophagus clarus]